MSVRPSRERQVGQGIYRHAPPMEMSKYTLVEPNADDIFAPFAVYVCTVDRGRVGEVGGLPAAGVL